MPVSLPSPAGGDPALRRPAAAILIVTADEALGARVQALLARVPRLTCLTARSGQAALKLLHQGGLELMLIDLPLPDLPGQALLERQCGAEGPAPLIALLEPGEERFGLELMQGGALGCLVKDARLAERLPPALEGALQRLAQQRQLAADPSAMDRLHDLSARLLEATGLSQLLEQTLDAAIALQRADFGHVQLYSRQPQGLEIVAQRGFQKDFLERFRLVREGEGAACGLALQRRRRVLIEDTEADPAFAPHQAVAAAAGFRAVQATPMFNRDGEPLGVLSTYFRRPHRPSEQELRLTDLYVRQAAGLIERTQAEEALRASEARYRALVHATSQAVWRVSADGERRLSLEGGVIHGHSEPETPPGDWLSKIHPEDRARTLEAWRRAVAAQSVYEIEHRALAAEGGYRHLLSRGVPVRDAAGEVLEWIGASADITERKQAELALREREAQLAFAQRVGRIGVWGLDLASQAGFVTPEWCDIIGIPEPVLAPTFAAFLALVHPVDRLRVEAAHRQAVETGQDIELEFRRWHPERGERWVLARARRVPSADGPGHRLLGVIIDITEQKRAEEALRASEERLRFAAQEAGFGSYELDLVTGQAYRSPEYKALFGLGPNDEFQLDADQVPVYVHPDDRALMREATRESRDPRGSGTKDVEYRVLLPDGTVRWLLVRGRVSFEGEGQARRAVRSRGIALDVTERKQLEQEILEISGREQRRIGHDLHDDLCQRLGGLQLLGGVLEKDLAAEGSSARAAQAGQLLARVQEALERARRLARGLAPVGLEEGGLATALQELAENAGQLFRIHCEFRAEAPVVAVADAGAATHLYRIAQEAISNAVRHGRASRVTLGLHRTGDGFELTVSDNGRGFSSTVATSGMGLRIMKYRAGMIGAALAVRSGIGQGTTVTCTFSAGLKAQRPKRQRAQAGRAKRKLTDASQAS